MDGLIHREVLFIAGSQHHIIFFPDLAPASGGGSYGTYRTNTLYTTPTPFLTPTQLTPNTWTP